MNKRLLIMLAVVAIATAVLAPVIAQDHRGRIGHESCGLMKKFDKKAKACRWRY